MKILNNFTHLFIFFAIWTPAMWALSAKASPLIGVVLAIASLAATTGYLFIVSDLVKFEEIKKDKPWL